MRKDQSLVEMKSICVNISVEWEFCPNLIVLKGKINVRKFPDNISFQDIATLRFSEFWTTARSNKIVCLTVIAASGSFYAINVKTCLLLRNI